MSLRSESRLAGLRCALAALAVACTWLQPLVEAQDASSRGLKPIDGTASALEAASKGRDYALLIAVDDYEQFPKLHNPVRDARELQSELEDVYKFTTTLLINATETEILDALREMALRTYAPEDQVFIFYAGHGEVDDLEEGYVSGRDSVPQSKGGRNPLSHAYLQRIMTRISAKHVFLLLDSCFSGTFDPRIAAAQTRSVYEPITTPELVARNLRLDARMWLASGRNEVVSDGVPGQGSPFARMLLDTLRSYGGGAGLVTTAHIFAAAQTLKTQPAWGELQNHSPGGQFLFTVGGRSNLGRLRLSPLEREQAGITAALDRYRTAYRNRSVDALVAVYPSLSRGERAELQQAFTDDCRAFEVTFATPQILLTNAAGTGAQVTVQSTYACTPSTGGRAQAASTEDVFELRKVGDSWQIAGTKSTLRR